MFEEVSQKVSKPSNSFVLFNHWDTAEHEDASMVKETKMKHYAKVKEILVERLKVMDEATAENRTFFVSAREAFENCLPQQKRHSLPPGKYCQGIYYMKYQSVIPIILHSMPVTHVIAIIILHLFFLVL